MEARVLVLLGAVCVGVCQGLSYDLFYSYGQQFRDEVLDRADDVSSDEIVLDVPLLFYDQRYSSVFVSTVASLTSFVLPKVD